ncbi:MAG TPA: T9SS type A sorting domain-containing protein [Ferruginibacter sp.]|nr:T9SS type A sorting domain-containing protein [Ferruginibacter sp.]HMP20589.1 T9SS type A sorting domain-containing protein [Ferruginibacter sp.]
MLLNFYAGRFCLLLLFYFACAISGYCQDVEPNNTLETASQAIVALPVNGEVNTLNDNVDFFKSIVPASGNLQIAMQVQNTGTEPGALLFSLYDSRKLSTFIIQRYVGNTTSISPGQSIKDTFNVVGLSADSIFFRFVAQGSSAVAFNYAFTFQLLNPAVDDPEPNNDWNSATLIKAGAQTQGNVGFTYTGITDIDDFYKGWQAQYGTIKMHLTATNYSTSAAPLYMALYDGRKQNGLLAYKYAGNINVLPGATVTDSLVVEGRAADSLYMRLQSSSGFAYTVWFTVADTTRPDAEPNNNFAAATPVIFDSVYTGNIYYAYRTAYDQHDYYRVQVPRGGTLKLLIEATRTNSVNTGYLFAMGYDETQQDFNAPFQRFLEENTNVQPWQKLNDTIVVNCFKAGTFYLRLSSSGSFAYQFRLQFENRTPEATMQFEQMGNEVGFRPQLTAADSFLWQFGDNTTSTLPYPLKTYSPGFYKARLVAVNNTCAFTDTALAEISIKGVEYYTPESAGSGGNLAMQVFGGGLDNYTVVKLIKGNTVITPFDVHSNNKQNVLTVEFDLHNADTGYYDVEITVPGMPVLHYPNGFKLDTLLYPYAWSAVQGPALWRTNRPNRFSLLVGNTGNVTAAGVVVAMVWSNNVEVQWEWPLYKPSFTGVDSLIDGDSVYMVDRSEFQYIFDSLNTTTAIDTFQGKPFNGYIHYFMVPYIPPGQVVSYPFFALAAAPGDVNFMSFTHRPNIFGSPATGVYTDYNNAVGTELLDAADMAAGKTNNPLFISFTKTAKIGEKHMRSAATAAGKKFWGWYDGYETNDAAILQDWLKETEANNEYAIQQFLQAAGDLTLKAAVNRAKKIQERLKFANQYMAKRPDMSPEMFEKYVEYINKTGKQIEGIDVTRLAKLKKLYDEAKYGAKLSKKLDLLQDILQNTPELNRQRKYLERHLDDNFFHDKLDRKPTRAVTSIDPNAIYGPAGKGTAGYIGSNTMQHFLVSFENLATASAAAQVVQIFDTLNTALFDMHSFSFGNITIGNRVYRVPPARKSIAMEVELNPVLRLRINAVANTVSGVVNWQFTTIDAATGGFPLLDGFLPPNISMPEGEGSVTYFVQPKSRLPSGTVFSNRAAIIFDDNEPIITNTWHNTLDTIKPASTMQANVAAGDSLITLRFSGSDIGAGIYEYAVYMSDNGGPWLRFGSLVGDSLLVAGDYDHSYSFYVTAVDSVGNEELKLPGAEAAVVLSRVVPVTLTRFSGVVKSGGNLLQWSTAAEYNSKSFTIEYSTDGSRFMPLTTIDTKAPGGFSQQALHYEWLHHQPAPKSWYRLVLQDTDGRKKYSAIIVLQANITTGPLLVMPNPSKSRITVQYSKNIEAISLVDLQGKMLQQWRGSGQVWQLTLPVLKPGMYLLQVFSEGTPATQKIMVY